MAVIDSFDEMLAQTLADIKAQDPSADISPATLLFIKTAAYTSADWAVASYLKQVARKPFPDLCLLDDLKHWATIKGVKSIDSYIDADGNFSRLVSEVLSRMQDPQSGGNAKDWPRWAKDCIFDHGDWIEHITWAKAYENKRYVGSVDIVIESDTPATVSEEIVPTNDLFAVVLAYLDSQRSIGIASDFRVNTAAKKHQGILLQVSSGAVETTLATLSQVQQAVIDYMKALPPGDTLYPAQIEAIAINAGLNIVNNSLAVPVVPLTGPSVYERLWPEDAGVSVYT
jgi:hypothetical protein